MKTTHSVSQLVDDIVEAAIKQRAVAIHIEPLGGSVRIRHRLHGRLVTVKELPTRQHAALVSRFKMLAGLTVTEHHLAQEAPLFLKHLPEAQAHLSVVPLHSGEKLVINVANAGLLRRDISQLGLSTAAEKQLRETLVTPHGLVAVCAQARTGSVLFKALQQTMQDSGLNVSSIDGNQDQDLTGISRIDVNSNQQSWSERLQAYQHQDLDILFVDDASQPGCLPALLALAGRGCLVVAGIPASDASGGVKLLQQYADQPALLAAALRLVVAERQLPKLCSHCRRSVELTASHIQRVLSTYDPSRKATSSTSLYEVGQGCSHCQNTGYEDQVLLLSILPVANSVQKLLLNQDVGKGLPPAWLSQSQTSEAAGHWLKGVVDLADIERLVPAKAY